METRTCHPFEYLDNFWLSVTPILWFIPFELSVAWIFASISQGIFHHLWIFHGGFTLLIAQMKYFHGHSLVSLSCKFAGVLDRETPIVPRPLRCRGTDSFCMSQHCALFDVLLAASLLLNFDACNADADVAAAGATCWDGRGEEEVHKSDADEHAGRGRGGCLLRGRQLRRRRPQWRRRWARGTRQRRARCPRDGRGDAYVRRCRSRNCQLEAGCARPRRRGRARCPPGRGRGRRWQCSGGDGHTSSQAVLYACCKVANWNKDLKRHYACHRSDRTAWLSRQRYCREAWDRFTAATCLAEARFQFNQSIITYFNIIFTSIITYFNLIFAHYYVIINSLLRHYCTLLQ